MRRVRVPPALRGTPSARDGDAADVVGRSPSPHRPPARQRGPLMLHVRHHAPKLLYQGRMMGERGGREFSAARAFSTRCNVQRMYALLEHLVSIFRYMGSGH